MPWTDEAREAARQRCIEQKPSQYSTGPRTEAGKRRSSLNALKTGLYCRWSVLRLIAKWQQEQEEIERLQAEMAKWLPDAIALKRKSPGLYQTWLEFQRNELGMN